MSDLSTVDFTLPKYGYLAFDATTMKAFIKERLNNSGVFTDQNFEGSNIAQIIDIFAYTFHTLIYYMNRTASEGMFTDSSIYENINRIVKTIGYNPIGNQTSMVAFKMTTSEDYKEGLEPGKEYLLPRFSSFSKGNTSFVTTEDIAFTVSDEQAGKQIDDFISKELLYEGTVEETPIQFATGNENEIFYINSGENVIIDHFSIQMFVNRNGKWEEWQKTPSLYLNNGTDNVYEIRLNENKYYEIKVGDDINGRKLNQGDMVQIFYIVSSGPEVSIAENELAGMRPKIHTGDVYDEIMTDIRNINPNQTVIDYDLANYLEILSNMSSTYFTEMEDEEGIRKNAPGIFRSQYRLVTAGDFENYIRTNYANLIQDVSVINNWEYLSGYLKYFYDLGISNPNNDGRVLINQVLFSDACNFNNVYVFCVPKLNNSDNSLNYMAPALKSKIIQETGKVKVMTSEVVILDPIYMGFGIGLSKAGYSSSPEDITNTKFYIVKKAGNKRDSGSIKADAINIIKSYFTTSTCKMGQVIDLAKIQNDILGIDGVESIYTKRTDEDTRTNNLALIKYNPIYPTDCAETLHNIQLEKYQFPYLSNETNIENQIEVVSNTYLSERIEY